MPRLLPRMFGPVKMVFSVSPESSCHVLRTRVAVPVFSSAPLSMLYERAYLIKCMMSLGYFGAIQFFLYSSVCI